MGGREGVESRRPATDTWKKTATVGLIIKSTESWILLSQTVPQAYITEHLKNESIYDRIRSQTHLLTMKPFLSAQNSA